MGTKIANLTELTAIDDPEDKIVIDDNSATETKFIKLSNLNLANTNEYVAASDASAASKAKATRLCDGTNDASQINAAIDQVTTLGGTVELSEGIFILEEAIIMKDDVWLRGQSRATTLFTITNLNVSLIQNGGVTVNRITISDMRIDGNLANNSAATQRGINIDGFDDCECRNLEVLNCESHLITLRNGDNARIINCLGHDGNADGFKIGDVGFTNDNGSIIGCECFNLEDTAIIVQLFTNAIVSGNNVHDIKQGLSCAECVGFSLTGNTCDTTTFNGIRGRGINMNDATDGTISGNAIVNSEEYNCFLQDCERVTITGNNFTNPSRFGVGNFDNIRLSNCKFCVISNNIVIDTTSNANYGIRLIGGNTADNQVNLNYVEGFDKEWFLEVGNRNFAFANRTESFDPSFLEEGSEITLQFHGTPNQKIVSDTDGNKLTFFNNSAIRLILNDDGEVVANLADLKVFTLGKFLTFGNNETTYLADDSNIGITKWLGPDDVGQGNMPDDITLSNLREYCAIVGKAESDVTTAEEGSLFFRVIDAGVVTNYIALNDTSLSTIQLLKPTQINGTLSMIGNDIDMGTTGARIDLNTGNTSSIRASGDNVFIESGGNDTLQVEPGRIQIFQDTTHKMFFDGAVFDFFSDTNNTPAIDMARSTGDDFDIRLYRDNGVGLTLWVNKAVQLSFVFDPTVVRLYTNGVVGITLDTNLDVQLANDLDVAGALTLGTVLAVLEGGTGVGTSTGTGNTVLSTSPTFVTPVLGIPASGDLTNCTGYVITNLNSGTKANLESVLSDVTDIAEADGDVYTGTHDFTGATVTGVPTGIIGFSGINETVVKATTEFIGFGGIMTATEANADYYCPRAGTLRNMRVFISKNDAAADGSTVTIRLNGATPSTPIQVTYDTGITGLLADTTNTLVVAAGDRIAIEVTNTGSGGGTKDIDIETVTLEYAQ